MANRATLKQYFETGDTPTQAQFYDLIDSVMNMTDETIIHVVTSAPSVEAGKDGDYAIDFTNSLYYQKYSGAWGAGVAFMGPQGPAGPTGAQGPAGNDGATGPQGPAGADGQPGTGVSWQGAWDSGTAYVADDGVSYQGSSYIANAPSSNSTPGVGAEWDLWVSKGEQGDTGPAGAQGATGATGAAGADGAGVPSGGSTNQYLKKTSGTDNDTEWDTIEVSHVSGLQTALDGKVDSSNLQDLWLDATDDAAVITALGSATFTDNVATVSGWAQGRMHFATPWLYVAHATDTVIRWRIIEDENTTTVSTSDPSGGADGDIWLKVSV